jgi:hypothetical protein
MTGAEHHEAAEAMLEDLWQHRETVRWSISDRLAQAQVHATLALAATLGLSADLPMPDEESGVGSLRRSCVRCRWVMLGCVPNRCTSFGPASNVPVRSWPHRAMPPCCPNPSLSRADRFVAARGRHEVPVRCR